MPSKKVTLFLLLTITFSVLVFLFGYKLYMNRTGGAAEEVEVVDSAFGDISAELGDHANSKALVRILSILPSENAYAISYYHPEELRYNEADVTLTCSSARFLNIEPGIILTGTCTNADCTLIGGECRTMEPTVPESIEE